MFLTSSFSTSKQDVGERFSLEITEREPHEENFVTLHFGLLPDN
jgi:hypothetical protein